MSGIIHIAILQNWFSTFEFPHAAKEEDRRQKKRLIKYGKIMRLKKDYG